MAWVHPDVVLHLCKWHSNCTRSRFKPHYKQSVGLEHTLRGISTHLSWIMSKMGHLSLPGPLPIHPVRATRALILNVGCLQLAVGCETSFLAHRVPDCTMSFVMERQLHVRTVSVEEEEREDGATEITLEVIPASHSWHAIPSQGTTTVGNR